MPFANNPLYESDELHKNVEPCLMIIFGATGDLTARKLMPALYNLSKDAQLPPHFACVGFARRDKSNEDFRKEVHGDIENFSRTKSVDPDIWDRFKEQIFYHRSEFHQDDGYESLKRLLEDLDKKFETKGNRVFYLSTPPKYFALIIQKLHQHGLIFRPSDDRINWCRVIIEKPFGHDLQSALELQKELLHYLDENQIYRIDHYLGKETVQNLLVFRFANTIFEAVWNRNFIDHVQITVSEEIGIGTRGKFFEEAGTLRDIIQNHMMQLLSLVAMEPPNRINAKEIRDEKVKVLQAVRPLPKKEIQNYVVRGQYGTGFIDGKRVKGYREEENVAPDSSVETYVALELSIDNWRWDGVPFYLRSGKRLPKRATEIAIIFKEAPGFMFGERSQIAKNILVIRIQPNEGISLKMDCKVPGQKTFIQPVKMDFRYDSFFGIAPPEAYERLICDCMAGDNTLFARDDEVIASWKLLTPILEFWDHEKIDFPNYAAGSCGPSQADWFLEKSGRKWRLI